MSLGKLAGNVVGIAIVSKAIERVIPKKKKKKRKGNSDYIITNDYFNLW